MSGNRKAARLTETEGKSQLKREIGFLDLTLFYVVSMLSLRWVASAAASGPSAIVVWILAFTCFALPLSASVLELSSRYPEEGGLYVWSREAFGDFAGFISAWTYWMSNLPYFAAVLYFAAGSALFSAGPKGAALANQSSYFMTFSVVALAGITFLNMRGVKPGKWLNNAGAVASWLPVLLLLLLGLGSYLRFGSATHFTWSGLVPHASLKNAIFWSTIFYAFAGVELASCMGGEIKDARRNVPRAIVFGGALVTLGYIGGTAAMLVVLPAGEISGLGGFMTAIARMCANLEVSWMSGGIALLVTVSSLGAASAYLAATSRLPFVAGIDHYLPAAFARIHPKWNTPYVAVLVYGLTGMLFAFLSQTATSVKGAYDVLVSMSVITYFIPYLYLFASLIRVQRRPVGPGVMRVPGGSRVAVPLALLGFLTTFIAICLSVIPEEDEPNKPLAVAKVVGMTLVLLGAGVLVYWLGKRRQRLVEKG